MLASLLTGLFLCHDEGAITQLIDYEQAVCDLKH